MKKFKCFAIENPADEESRRHCGAKEAARYLRTGRAELVRPGVIRLLHSHHGFLSGLALARLNQELRIVRQNVNYDAIPRVMTLKEIAHLPCVAAHKLIRCPKPRSAK